MIKKFEKYFNSIGISNPIKKRINEIYDYCSQICPEPFNDIFIEDYIKEDGIREYSSVSFFSNNYVVSSSEFKTKLDFTVGSINEKYCGISIKMQDYDFKKATEKSRLHVTAPTNIELYTELKASKENCDFLRDIILKYLIPNLIK